MLEKINVKACNVVFTLITFKQRSFIVQTHIWNQQAFLHLEKTAVFTVLAAVIPSIRSAISDMVLKENKLKFL